MSATGDMVYVLSCSGTAGETIFLHEVYDYKNDKIANLDRIVKNLTNARIFDTEREAWECRELCASAGWQITPISAKRLFTDKLKG